MFEGCSSLTEATAIPDGVKDCSNMFRECTALIKAPTIPNSVIKCTDMFRDCSSLTEAPIIPNGVKGCSRMFKNCTSLTKGPVIPHNIISCISMFQGCSSLTEAFAIPEGIREGEADYFYGGCDKLKKIKIPKGDKREFYRRWYPGCTDYEYLNCEDDEENEYDDSIPKDGEILAKKGGYNNDYLTDDFDIFD
jgi:hypothetical protein